MRATLLVTVVFAGCTPPGGRVRAALLVTAVFAGCTPGGGRESGTSASTSTPVASAKASASAAPDAGPTAPFHCFSWAHMAQHSTDCFRSVADCESARAYMERGARPSAPCRPAERAACTMVSRPPEHPVPSEHCFGDVGACSRYRAFVTKNGVTVTACEDR